MNTPRPVWLSLFVVAAVACHGDAVSPDSPEDLGETSVALPDAALLAAGATITPADLAERLGVLADDSMKGRFTARPELEVAAEYIAGVMADAGIRPGGNEGFFERWRYPHSVLDTTGLTLELAGAEGPTLAWRRDYAVAYSSPGDASGPVLWGGSVASPDARGLSMAGRVVLYDLPVTQLDLSAFLTTAGAYDAIVNEGAAAVGFVVPPEFTEDDMAEASSFTGRLRRVVPMFLIRETAAATLLAAAGVPDLETLRAEGPQVLDTGFHVHAQSRTVVAMPPNVVGVLPGSDVTLGHEYVVVSAHFDHLGTSFPDATGDSIFNGADDNASGTSVVLEVARALGSMDEAPARSVLFLLFSGEEEGLLGSKQFTQGPREQLLPSIVADVNVDMVSRNDPGEIIGVGQEYTSLGGAARALAAAAPELGLQVVPDLQPAERLFFRSDQLSFVCHDVPALFFTSGLHEDYHLPTDEFAASDTDKAARVARLVLYLVHGVANAPDKPWWTEQGQTARNQPGTCS